MTKTGAATAATGLQQKAVLRVLGGVLQGLKPLGFVVGRCVAVETATYKTWGRSFCDHRVRCGVGSQGRKDCGVATAHRQECLCQLKSDAKRGWEPRSEGLRRSNGAQAGVPVPLKSDAKPGWEPRSEGLRSGNGTQASFSRAACRRGTVPLEQKRPTTRMASSWLPVRGKRTDKMPAL
jgi:hypothetical protein